MLIYCEKLYDFHDYMLQLLNELGVESTSDMFQSIGYQRIFMLGFTEKQRDVNIYFLNFMLSVARLCIAKNRQMVKNGISSVNLVQFFRYTLKHYVTYLYIYCKCTNNFRIFKKKFLENNNIILEDDDILFFSNMNNFIE